MNKLSELKIKIFADSGNLEYLKACMTNPFFIQGYTTNPSLLKESGVRNYEEFCKTLIPLTEYPISFEVFADEPVEMLRQARKISSWGKNVYVKIPITYTNGESTFRVIEELSKEGIKLNITAILHPDQVAVIEPVLSEAPAIISIFAGRISDCGRDPIPLIDECSWILNSKPNTEILWASTRQLYDIVLADSIGCDIITVPQSILNKINLIGKDLKEYSRETVQTFYDDAATANYTL